MREPVNLSSKYGKGTYAVVAGASDATGQAYCDRLRKEGFNLILVDDCSQKKLDALSKNYGSAPAFHFDFKRKSTW